MLERLLGNDSALSDTEKQATLDSIKPIKIQYTNKIGWRSDSKPLPQEEAVGIKVPSSFDLLKFLNVPAKIGDIDSDTLDKLENIQNYLSDIDSQHVETLLEGIESRMGRGSSYADRIANIDLYIASIQESSEDKDLLGLMTDDRLLIKLEEEAQHTGVWNKYLEVVERVKNLRRKL